MAAVDVSTALSIASSVKDAIAASRGAITYQYIYEPTISQTRLVFEIKEDARISDELWSFINELVNIPDESMDPKVKALYDQLLDNIPPTTPNMHIIARPTLERVKVKVRIIPSENSKIVYTVWPYEQITDELLNRCAILFSEHYGAWSENPEYAKKLPRGAVPGQKVKLTAKTLRTGYLFNESCGLVTAELGNQLVGHVFYTRFYISTSLDDDIKTSDNIDEVKINYSLSSSDQKEIRWATQLVVDAKHRSKQIAQTLLLRSSGTDVQGYGLVTSHPHAVRALEKTARGRHCTPIPSIRAMAILKASGIPYLKNSEIKMDENTSIINTNFFVDHKDALAALLEVIKTSNKMGWFLGKVLPDGHEFFAFIGSFNIKITDTIREVRSAHVETYAIICCSAQEATQTTDVFKKNGCLFTKYQDKYGDHYMTTMENSQGRALVIRICPINDADTLNLSSYLLNLLDIFKPQWAFMTGLCAGNASSNVKLGDLVIGTDVVSQVHIRTSFRKIVVFTSSHTKASVSRYTLGEKTKSYFMDVSQMFEQETQATNLVNETQIWNVNIDTRHPDNLKSTIHTGTIVSGSNINNWSELQSVARSTIIGADMESDALYATVNSYNKFHNANVRSIIIKGICDIGDSSKDDLYYDYATQISAAFVYKYLYTVTPRNEVFDNIIQIV